MFAQKSCGDANGRCRRCLEELAIGEVDYRSVRIVQGGRSYTAEIREDFLKEVAFGWVNGFTDGQDLDRPVMGKRPWEQEWE